MPHRSRPSSTKNAPRPPFFRPLLKALEDRLPPGDLLAAAWGGMGSMLFSPDALAASDLALVPVDAEGRGPGADDSSEAEESVSTRPAKVQGPDQETEEPTFGGTRGGQPTATGIGSSPFDTPPALNGAEDLLAALRSASAADGRLFAGAFGSGRTVAGIDFAPAVQSSLPTDQALIEALAAPAAAATEAFPVGAGFSSATDSGRAPTAKLPDRQTIAESYGRLPLTFEANVGQTDSQVRFLARGSGYALFLTDDGAVLRLHQPGAEEGDEGTSAVVHMQVVGVREGGAVVGRDEQPGRASYFVGNDPNLWRAGIATFDRVEYQGVYDGIDLVYYGNQQQLEYDFVVALGADSDAIRMRFAGAEQLRIDADGNLVLDTAAGSVVQQRPFLYQETDGVRQPVAGNYVLRSANEVGFAVGEYDTARTLVIDPVLSYSSYLGGSGFDYAYAVAVDAAGNAYVTGETASTNFPTTTPVPPGTFGGGQNDVFVTKINATGTALLYSTYLGGENPDRGNAIAIDGAGNAYIAGHTFSPTLSTTSGVFQPTNGGGFGIDGFVAKFNPSASGAASLVYLSFLGGNNSDSANGITLDGAGNAYVVGETDSITFPVRGTPFQSTFGGGFNDAFVAKVNPTATTLVYSTYLGGFSDDRAYAVAVDSAGNAHLTGFTSSTDFPTRRAVQPVRGGGYDAFATKLDAAGSALVYSTFLGGSADENQLSQGEVPSGIALDASGAAYIAGRTASTNFPTRAAFQPNSGGPDDAFLAKIVDDAAAPLSVSGLSVTPAGFVLDFNRPIDPSLLNLYDLQTGGPGPADVTLVGTTVGLVNASLVADATGTRLTFVQTDGVLAPDTYTLTLRSAADGFRQPGGGPLLDGNRDGTPGDNFVTTFTVAASTAVAVSVPDFARGPGQPVDVPATSTRLPLRLSSGAGVLSVALTLTYNPALLTITAATVGAGLPGATVNLTGSTPGRAVVTFSSPTALPAMPLDFVTLTATVPAAAPNGASHVLDIGNLAVNNGALASRDDDGLHLVAFFGDASGNGAYTSLDAQRVLRVAVGLDSGFAPYPRTSAIILADITGNGTLNATDATRVLQEVVGLDRPEIPPIP